MIDHGWQTAAIILALDRSIVSTFKTLGSAKISFNYYQHQHLPYFIINNCDWELQSLIKKCVQANKI